MKAFMQLSLGIFALGLLLFILAVALWWIPHSKSGQTTLESKGPLRVSVAFVDQARGEGG